MKGSHRNTKGRRVNRRGQSLQVTDSAAFSGLEVQISWVEVRGGSESLLGGGGPLRGRALLSEEAYCGENDLAGCTGHGSEGRPVF